MPKIKFDHIVSFSSEDPVHVANNILISDPAKKWKCRTAGEINANIVLQLEKASKITSIDIGNENSAFIEILVSRSSTTDDYKPLLVMSSFMTALEARQGNCKNKVRMFKFEELSQPERNEKWDRVKIVCTQPFNRHVQYGLSFINLYSNESVKEDTKPNTMAATIGNFTIRPESPDNLSAGSLFARRKEILKEEPLKAAVAIREATTLAAYGTPTNKKKIKIIPNGSSTKKKPQDNSEEKEKPKARNRNELLYQKDEEDRNEKIDKIIEKKEKEKEEKELKEQKEREKTPKHSKKLNESKDSDKKKPRTESSSTPKQDKKHTKNEDKNHHKQNNNNDYNKNKRKSLDVTASPSIKKPKISKKSKPFHKLFEGVVLVISGIQNPDRANLRTSALTMGAKYKPDWEGSCTHLICAFANTPKFNQVKGKGKIVKKQWIEDSYRERKRLPWRRYALDKVDKNQEESEEEIFEKLDEDEPASSQNGNGSDTEDEIEAIRQMESQGNTSKASSSSSSFKNDEHKQSQKIKKESTPIKHREKSPKPSSSTKRNGCSSDTDDDIQFVKESPLKTKIINSDIYSVDTDSDDISEISKPKISPTKKFKDLFDDKRFYIDSSFVQDKIAFLRRYIVAYKGLLIDDPTEEIDYIITKSENVETIKEINSTGTCISSHWITECHNKQKLIPHESYILT